MKKFLQLSSLLFILGCASIDLPPGGQKDTQPPVVVKSSPDSLETLFTGTEIKITFDEYFTLNNLNQSLIVSPPLSNTPKTIVKGKSFVIQPKELLKPNTTYQFYLADGIKDLNEGNPTKNLKLVFSTGSIIDTAFISGSVKGVFSLKPEDGVKVFLYKEFLDSQLFKNTAYYITKTEKSGVFSFTNIADGQYYAYAVLDENNNNKLDFNERVAFASKPFFSNTRDNFLLLSKEPIQPDLRIGRVDEPSQGLFTIVFNKTISSKNIHIKTSQVLLDISKDRSVPWHFGKTQDTLYAYINTKENVDSIQLTLNIDSTIFEETIRLKTKKVTQPHIFCPERVKPTEPLILSTNYLIRKTNQEKIVITDLTDSTTFLFDSTLIGKKDVSLFSFWKENHTYKVVCLEGFNTYSNQKNSQLDTFTFTVANSEKTGEIEIVCSLDSTLSYHTAYFLVLLKDNKEYGRKVFTKDTQFTFSYLEPGEYFAHIFQDKNQNGFWDDQNYFKNSTPEPIWRLSDPIDVRTKWKTKGIRFKIK